MSDATRSELVILGGGCAGLSLAARLASLPAPPRVHVVEAREAYENDRTWCFWAPRHHRWSSLVSGEWSSWSFSSSSEQVVQRPRTPLSYQAIAADAFACAMIQAIGRAPDVELHLGVAATAVEPEDGRVRVRTQAGDLLADRVVDTRPRPGPPDAFGQRFVGAEVEIDHDGFDTSTAGLMLDMDVDEHGFRFTYVLPYSSRFALVEETRFGRAVPSETLHAGLASTLSELAGDHGPRVVRREGGFIPMTTQEAAPDPSGSVAAGLRGGAARPSTGYAFLRIQQWADDAAASLARGGPLVPPRPEPRWRKWVDGLFLDVLDTQPELAPQLFVAMADRVPPETLVRFLSDDARRRDFARVATALPPTPFVRRLLTRAAGGA